uniref:DUF2231 domain-containing protein n=2 Tax=Sphingomonas TaxID=13687 RepID=UPI003704CCDE
MDEHGSRGQVMGGKRGGTFAILLAVAISVSTSASAHEDHNALGAGPGPVANSAAETQKADGADAGDDMDMGGMHEETANKNKSFGERLVSWLGRLHTMVIHFPIAMFIGAFGLELFGLWRRNRDYQHVAHIMLVVGALGAIAAAFLGWFAGGFYLTDRNPILMTHRWLGTSIAVFGVVLAWMAARHRKGPERSRSLYWVVLGLMTLAISIQGFLGGTFMHGGINHLAF